MSDTLEEKKYDMRHGGPFDRGGADSYYGRNFNPHYYKDGSYSSERVGYKNMTEEEIEAYRAGWEDNEKAGIFKNWG